MNTSALLSYFVVFPEVSGVAGFTYIQGFTFKATVDRADLTYIVGVREVLVNTVTLVVLELSVDSGLAGLTVLGISTLDTIFDSVVASLTGAILV